MFKQIVLIDETRLSESGIEQLSKLSENPIKVYKDSPSTNAEKVERIREADAVFVSWGTQLRADVLQEAPQLKYIGMCCSLYDSKSANVAIEYAAKTGITVKGIRDYGDEGLVEFVISSLIQLLKGLGKYQWKSRPVELTNKKVGIIGLGTTGMMLAKSLQAFKSEVSYFSRTRKPEAEAAGITYLPLEELLETSEIVSLHLPRNTFLLKEKEFELFGNGKVFINTSLGLTFDKTAFEHWMAQGSNYAILDGDGMGAFNTTFRQMENIISMDNSSGWTMEAQERLSTKVLENVYQFLQKGKV